MISKFVIPWGHPVKSISLASYLPLETYTLSSDRHLNASSYLRLQKTDDISKYTPDAILSPSVADINTLALAGISTTCSTGCTLLKEHLAFLADNLASHAIGGFKESFSLS